MNPEVKAKWVAALRSPDYRQGFGMLAQIQPSHSVSYCCLGVLCELAAEAGVVERIHHSEHIEYSADPSSIFRRDYVYPPPEVVDWAGLPARNPEVILDEDDRPRWNCEVNPFTLASLNDDFGFTFSDIADVIEKYFPDVLTCTDCGEQTPDVRVRAEWPNARLCDVDYQSRLASVLNE